MSPQTGLQICQRGGEEGGESLAEGWCEDSSEPWEEVWGGEDRCGQGWSRAAVGGRGGGRGMQKDTLLLLCWISSTHLRPWGGLGAGPGGERGKTRGYRKMRAPEASAQGRLPAAVPAVEGDDSALVRRPFDAWGKKVWFFR